MIKWFAYKLQITLACGMHHTSKAWVPPSVGPMWNGGMEQTINNHDLLCCMSWFFCKASTRKRRQEVRKCWLAQSCGRCAWGDGSVPGRKRRWTWQARGVTGGKCRYAEGWVLLVGQDSEKWRIMWSKMDIKLDLGSAFHTITWSVHFFFKWKRF